MGSSVTIESLIKAANSSECRDTSLNVAKRIFLHQPDADDFFKLTCSNLLNIREWNKNSSVTSYKLFNESGQVLESEPISVGNFIRIGLYGAGKYDWVRAISIADDTEEVILTVKPSFDPTEKPPDVTSTSHFFVPEATNNFCVQQVGKSVAFYVIGLNERQNIKFTDGLIESARNAAVANIGYYSGLQKAVWKQFCTNFVAASGGKG